MKHLACCDRCGAQADSTESGKSTMHRGTNWSPPEGWMENVPIPQRGGDWFSTKGGLLCPICRKAYCAFMSGKFPEAAEDRTPKPKTLEDDPDFKLGKDAVTEDIGERIKEQIQEQQQSINRCRFSKCNLVIPDGEYYCSSTCASEDY